MPSISPFLCGISIAHSILVRCDVADALEGMQLVSKYNVNDKKVETPTVLISEPPRYTSELALAELVTSIAKKLNK